MTINQKNIVFHSSNITCKVREEQNGHISLLLWFTGFSCAGKSTLAHAVEEKLHQKGCRTFVLDGDNVRFGLCSDLGFSVQDRKENIRRIAEAGKLMVEAGVIAMTAFISPFREDRQKARALFSAGDFIEIYCNAELEICESRDVKGLYQRAREGEVKEFTGISSPYEQPLNPELTVNTGTQTLEESVDQVMAFLQSRGMFQ